jgi:hypothetical protein
MSKRPRINLAEPLSPNAEQIIALIHSYRALASKAVLSMRQHFRTENLLSARRQGLIPPRGKIGATAFSFHGVGCWFQLPNGSIDVDFGPGEKFDGFDAWRLKSLIDDNPAIWNQTRISEQQIQSGLNELLAVGEIVLPRLDPTPHLYYVNESSNS